MPPHQSPAVTASPGGGSHICGLPVRLIYRDGCNGRHICRPYKPTHKISIATKPRAGHAPPLPRDDLYCPVGRGDPTPPRNRAVDAICLFGCRGEHCSPERFARQVDSSGRLRGRSMTAPTNDPLCCCNRKAARRGQDPSLRITGRQAIIGKMPVPGGFVGDGLDRPVRFTRYVVISGAVATGGIVAVPTDDP